MKVSSILWLSLMGVSDGFQVFLPYKPQKYVSVPHKSTMTSNDETADDDRATTMGTTSKEKLLEISTKLKEEYGVFLIDKASKKEFSDAVEELEQEVKDSQPSADDYDPKQLLGDWILLCTTATSRGGIDTSKLPFFKEGPLKNIRDSLNQCVTVVQSIRSKDEDGSDSIDRIDHILEYNPPDSLKQIVENLPEALTSLNINPLEVSTSKVVLVHKAEIESGTQPLRTKLALESIILNVAGTSKYLEPDGKDVLGLNVPLGEFVNAGSFETTYVDDTLRISRGKNGLVDQLRVFVKSEDKEDDESVEAKEEEDDDDDDSVSVTEENDSSSD